MPISDYPTPDKFEKVLDEAKSKLQQEISEKENEECLLLGNLFNQLVGTRGLEEIILIDRFHLNWFFEMDTEDNYSDGCRARYLDPYIGKVLMEINSTVIRAIMHGDIQPLNNIHEVELVDELENQHIFFPLKRESTDNWLRTSQGTLNPLLSKLKGPFQNEDRSSGEPRNKTTSLKEQETTEATSIRRGRPRFLHEETVKEELRRIWKDFPNRAVLPFRNEITRIFAPGKHLDKNMSKEEYRELAGISLKKIQELIREIKREKAAVNSSSSR